MAAAREHSAPPTSPGSTIDDPNMAEDEQTDLVAHENDPASSPLDASSPALKPESSVDRQLKKSPRTTLKHRKPKPLPARTPLSWVKESAADANTEDEDSMVGDDGHRMKKQRSSDSTRNSEVDVKHGSSAPTATTVSTRRQANGTIGSVYSGNKIRHIKKDDGVPLWRKDIQYEFLKTVFNDKRSTFTRVSDSMKNCNFADIYIDAMANSSKTSKVLKDKLKSDREAAENMAMICLLVNVGRMNTTLNFFPEMRAQLRTYHAIPALQAHADSNTYKQLQDAPRLKSILKGASEDNPDEPHTIEAIQAHSIPRTNPVNLIFALSQSAPNISETHFSSSIDFFDLVIRPTLSSYSRAQAFLWLMWWYLESNFTKDDALSNPFGPALCEAGAETAIPLKVPELKHLTEEQGDAENVDTEDEIAFGEEMRLERKRILESEEADNKPLKRVKKAPLVDDVSDVDSLAGRSLKAGSPAPRESVGFQAINPTLKNDPSVSQLGGQADSLEDDWEPVNPHPGRGRYKRVKTAKAAREDSASALPQHPMQTTNTSSSGRILMKTSKAQSYPADPGTSDGAGATPQPPGAAHPILHQYGPTTEALARGDAPLGAVAGTTGSVQRRPRPLTQHQMQVEANRRQRVHKILQKKREKIFVHLRAQRESSNFVIRSVTRIQSFDPGYDSEDEGTTVGMGGLGPNLYRNEEDDFGEEAEMWHEVVKKAQKRLGRWSGDDALRHRAHVLGDVDGGPVGPQLLQVNSMYDHDGEVVMEETTKSGGRRAPMPRMDSRSGLDEIDRDLLVERSDDTGDDESEGSGADSDVEMD